jgi:hypothetical protein
VILRGYQQQVNQDVADIAAGQALVKTPRFINNPEAIQKAQAVYDGTY